MFLVNSSQQKKEIERERKGEKERERERKRGSKGTQPAQATTPL